jgi:hypothetical protein
MRGARYDQFDSSALLSLWGWGAPCLVVILTTPVLAIFSIESGNFIYIPFLIVLFFGAIYLLVKKQKEYSASYQARRDQAAIKLFNAVLSGDVQKFAVFLRPFYTTDKIKETQMFMVPQWSGSSMTMRPMMMVHGLEDTIVGAFRSATPVVALGKPGETFGVGRILVNDDDWQSAASKLMRDSSLIICVPSSRPGSNWELDQIIRTDYRTKTVFIMPPESPFGGWKQLEEDWDLLRQQEGSNGIAIPNYQRSGLLFSIDAKGQCLTEDLHFFPPQRLQQTIARLNSSARTPKPTMQEMVRDWIDRAKTWLFN